MLAAPAAASSATAQNAVKRKKNVFSPKGEISDCALKLFPRFYYFIDNTKDEFSHR